MKHSTIIYIVLYSFFSTTLLFTALPGLPSTSTKNWLTAGPISETNKHLIDSVQSYPMVATTLANDGVTHKAQQLIKNRTLAATIPPKIVPILKHGSFSVLRGKSADFKNYPKGATLFPDYPTLATKFDQLINVMVTTPKFKAFFNKIHLNILNELYSYLMNIYTNFNLQHVGIKETTANGTITLQFDIPGFLQNEQAYEANKKTLIINHLVNIIESQMNGKIKSIMPKIPHLFATAAGKTLIQNDYSIDLTHFIIKQIDPGMIQYQQTYLKGLAAYLSFFQEYTSYLKKPHPNKSQHFTAFVHIAETLNLFLYGSANADKQNADSVSQMQTVLQKMDPPLFTFNYDDIRALKLIPHIAKSLPAQTESIMWPSHIVNAAVQQTFVSNHPIAYFKDDNYQITTSQAQAKHLYVVLQSGKNFFEEELVAQPDWLNSWEDGVVNILSGCFGDFSALIGMNILDPCMEALIQNAVDTMNGKPINSASSFTSVCHKFLDAIQDQKIAQINQPTTSATTNANVNTILQTQLPSTQPPSTDDSGASINNIPGLNPSNSDLTPSADDMSPTNNDLSPNTLSPSVGDMSPTNNDLSPSGSDISSMVTQ